MAALCRRRILWFLCWPLLGASTVAVAAGAGTWSPTGVMKASRLDATATPLPDGRVLVCGGWPRVRGYGPALSSCETWDPTTDRWTPAPGLTTARAEHVAVALADGGILIAGGKNERESGLASAEVWEPTGARRVHDMPRRHPLPGFSFASALALPDGRVIVFTHGQEGPCLPGGDIWNPAIDSWEHLDVPGGAPCIEAAAIFEGRLAIAAKGNTSVCDLQIRFWDPVNAGWSEGPHIPDRACMPQFVAAGPDEMRVAFRSRFWGDNWSFIPVQERAGVAAKPFGNMRTLDAILLATGATLLVDHENARVMRPGALAPDEASPLLRRVSNGRAVAGLPDGRVLIAGGEDAGNFAQVWSAGPPTDRPCAGLGAYLADLRLETFPGVSSDPGKDMARLVSPTCRNLVEQRQAPDVTSPLLERASRPFVAERQDPDSLHARLMLCILHPSWAVSTMRDSIDRNRPDWLRGWCLAGLAEADTPEANAIVDGFIRNDAVRKESFWPTSYAFDKSLETAVERSHQFSLRSAPALHLARRHLASESAHLFELACRDLGGAPKALLEECAHARSIAKKASPSDSRLDSIKAVVINTVLSAGVVALGYESRNAPGGRALAIGSGVVGGLVAGFGVGMAAVGPSSAETNGLAVIFGGIPGAALGALGGGVLTSFTSQKPGTARFATTAVSMGLYASAIALMASSIW